jgi:hypothetical protein
VCQALAKFSSSLGSLITRITYGRPSTGVTYGVTSRPPSSSVNASNRSRSIAWPGNATTRCSSRNWRIVSISSGDCGRRQVDAPARSLRTNPRDAPRCIWPIVAAPGVDGTPMRAQHPASGGCTAHATSGPACTPAPWRSHIRHVGEVTTIAVPAETGGAGAACPDGVDRPSFRLAAGREEWVRAAVGPPSRLEAAWRSNGASRLRRSPRSTDPPRLECATSIEPRCPCRWPSVPSVLTSDRDVVYVPAAAAAREALAHGGWVQRGAQGEQRRACVEIAAVQELDHAYL